MGEILSRVHANNLVRWAADKPNAVVFSADLTGSTEVDLFRDAYPGRFFSFGVAEQNMLSFAGGMAREGFLPLVHTFGVFIYRRAYDQVAMSVAYPNLPVRMFGFLPGVTTPGGATHQAIEDVALMRSLPNMTVLDCGDATDVETVLDAIETIPGPVYVRMLRGEVPRLFAAAEPLRVGRSRLVHAPASGPADLAVFSSGICTEEAIRAVRAMADRGLAIHHRHVSTLKPFDDPAILAAAVEARCGVITMENHVVVGGLGSAVAETLAEAGVGKKLVRIGLADTFAHGASKAYLMKEYGLDAAALIRRAEGLLGRTLNIGEADLAAVRIEPVHSMAKAEAL
ncbi:MAG: transketolase [Planctomycetota bacterium]|nr:transketolase [Planctomycetota bacterium]